MGMAMRLWKNHRARLVPGLSAGYILLPGMQPSEKEDPRLAQLHKQPCTGDEADEKAAREYPEPSRRNRSGIRGVSWAQNANKWTARGFRDVKPIHLGYFSDIEDAKKAREDFLKRNLPALEELEQIPLDQEEEQ